MWRKKKIAIEVFTNMIMVSLLLWLPHFELGDDKFMQNERIWCEMALTRLIAISGGFLLFRILTLFTNPTTFLRLGLPPNQLAFGTILVLYEFVVQYQVIHFYIDNFYVNKGVKQEEREDFDPIFIHVLKMLVTIVIYNFMIMVTVHLLVLCAVILISFYLS